MKKLNIILGTLFILALPAMAQEEKTLTLEELILGGNKNFSLQPEYMFTTWWGDKPVITDVESASAINLKNGEQTTVLTLEPLKKLIKDEGRVCKRAE